MLQPVSVMNFKLEGAIVYVSIVCFGLWNAQYTDHKNHNLTENQRPVDLLVHSGGNCICRGWIRIGCKQACNDNCIRTFLQIVGSFLCQDVFVFNLLNLKAFIDV